MKQTIYIGMVTVLLLCCTALQAQYKHEFSVYGGGGLSTLQYDVNAGEQKNGFGGMGGLGYSFFFSPKWGLGTGVELSFYNAKFNLDNFRMAYPINDGDGDAFEFRSTVNGYEEKQNAMFLQIPLMLQFQTGSKHQFYASAGGKIGIPVNGKYKSSGTTIQNSGYYAEENYEYTTQEFMGFGTFAGNDADGDLKFKTTFFVSAEAGVKWKLTDKLSLYTGAYIDYGLNNICKDEASQQFIAYNNQSPREFAVNNATQSQYTQNGVTQSFTDKIVPLAAGIKLRLAFGTGKFKEKEKEATAEIIPVIEKQPEMIADDNEAKRKEAEANKREMARMQIVKSDIQEPVENYHLSQIELNNTQKQELDKKITLLQQNPGLRFYIYGHTCNTGSKEINRETGLQRAEKTKEYLLSKGIGEERILGVVSKGDAQPLVPNTGEENRQMNRRVEIILE